jgi:NADH dehydrogenase FAD-containing subunit
MLGRRRAVGVVFGVRLHGILARFLGRSYHLFRLPRRRPRVAVDWFVAGLRGRDMSRLGVGAQAERAERA